MSGLRKLLPIVAGPPQVAFGSFADHLTVQPAWQATLNSGLEQRYRHGGNVPATDIPRIQRGRKYGVLADGGYPGSFCEVSAPGARRAKICFERALAHRLTDKVIE